MNAPIRTNGKSYKDCEFPNCGRGSHGHGLCSMHRRQQLTGKPLRPLKALRNRPGEGWINQDGYRHIWVDGTPVLEHRHVMSTILGRLLRDDETVHHKNGNKLDNSPENLELWSKYQPSGQRVSDKLKWAKVIVARYGATEEPDDLHYW